MKSIKGWNDWYIHPFTLVYLILSGLIGILDRYLWALLIVCIHEYAHYYFARKFAFEIERVEVFPFGAFLSIRDYGLHHIIEEMIVIMAGLSVHLPLAIIFNWIENDYLCQINCLVFGFNLLPVYPLDGSKLLLLILSLFKDYHRAIKLQIKLSILTLSILIVTKLDPNYLFCYLYLLYINYKYWRDYRYLLIRLYIRRSQQCEYQRYKINRNLNFYRPYHNVYLFAEKTYPEKEVIYFLIKKLKSD